MDALDAYPDKDKIKDENGLHFEFGDWTYSISYGELKNNVNRAVDQIAEKLFDLDITDSIEEVNGDETKGE
jgi:hypothetical protein